MARTIATIGGTALAPGVSRNRRLYTREHLVGAVATAQGRLARGDQPMVMLTHHDAGDDSTRIAASLTSLSLTEDCRIRWAAGIPDTEAGRAIASLADTSDGQPAFLEGVSIRGRWTGKVRKVRGPDGEAVETADGLEIDGLDFTHKPGVPEARIDTFAWATSGASETDERVPITESAEALVTITEDSPPAPPTGVREALRSLFGEAISGGSTPPVHKRDSGLSDESGRKYADPGYQADHKQRYDISTKAKAKAAWSYVNQADNAKAYSAAQLKRVKSRIRAALKGFGVTVAAEGWCVEPALLITEAIAEYAGMDPECAGSYSLSATNGPTTVTVCSYGLDPADLQLILAQACKGAGMALCALDPDMDADIDVPGADAEDDDNDADALAARIAAAIRGESADDLDALLAEARGARPAVTEAAPVDPAPEPAAANQGMEAPMPETTTTEAAGAVTAATFTQADLDAAVTRGIAQAEEARRARKAAKKGAAPAESAPAAPAPVTETDDERIARLVREGIAAAIPAESEADKIARLVRKGIIAAKQDIAESGGVTRKGLVAESGARPDGEIPADFPMREGRMIPSEEWSEDQRRAVGRQLERYVLGSRASS